MKGLSSTGPLIWQRLVSHWWLLVILGVGMLIAATLLAVSPVYTRVMNDLGLQQALKGQARGFTHNAFVVPSDRLGDPQNPPRYRDYARMMSEEIGWFTESEVHYAAMPLTPVTSDEADVTTPGTLIHITSFSGIEEHVNVVAGRLPEPTSDPTSIEVLMPLEAARYIDMQPGQSLLVPASFDDCNRPPPSPDPEVAAEFAANFSCTPQTTVDLEAQLTVVGFIERIDPEAPYWSAGAISFGRPYPAADVCAPSKCPILPVVLPQQTFFQALASALPRFPYELRVTGFADLDRLNSSNLDDAQASLARLNERLDQNGAIATLSMERALNSFENQASFNQIVLLLLLLQIAGLAAYFVFLVASLLAEHRSEEVAMLRSRGATTGQLVAMATAEAFVLGLVVAFIAPVVASAAVSALGKTGTFDSISGGDFLPFTIVPAAFAFALGGAAIAALATVIPALIGAKRGLVPFLQSTSRPGKPLLQRYYLDLGLVGLSALALWQLNQKGSVFDSRSVGGWSADPLLLLSPLLLILAIGALMFRFLPPLLGLISRMLARTSGPGVMLGLWQLTRSPARYTQLALLVVMAAAIGTFASTYGETTSRSQEERALYAIGSDVRLTGLGDLGRVSEGAVEQLESVEGIENAATAHRATYRLGPLPNFGPSVGVLGVEPLEAENLLWFRDDFADEDLRSLMLRIAGSPLPERGITLPGEPTSVSVWARPIETRIATTLWLRTRDAEGVYRYHRFGPLDFDGYRRLEAPIEAQALGITYPLSVVGLIMTQPQTIIDQSPEIIFDDLMTVNAAGEETVVDDFEGAFRWEVLRTATRNRDEVQLVGEDQAHSGTGAVRFSFLTGTNAPMRGLTVKDPDVPLPAIVSQRLLDVTGLGIGGEVQLVFGRLLLPVTIQGVVDYFPTMYDSAAGFVILNQEHLYHYAGVTNQEADTQPSEAWVTFTQEEGERMAAQAALYDRFSITSGQIIDREAVLDNIRTDPVVRAGGSGILLLALVAAFTILALGFALSLYLGGKARTVEVSVMRAVGISPRQLLAMISLEYLLIAAIGLVVGTIAGLRISDTMLSFLEVSETGAIIVPPYSLVTSWDTLAVAFGTVGIAFLGGVLALAGYFLRLPVSRIIRLTR